MTNKKAKEIGFTHKGLVYDFIPIYFGCEFEIYLTGVNLFWDIALDILSVIDSVINFSGDAFNIDLTEEL